MSKIIFAYAVDGGLFNSVTNFAHKIISPKTYGCSLCALTHGALSAKPEWTDFIKQIKQPVEFLHRDELAKAFPSNSAPLPAIFREEGSKLEVLVSADELNRRADLDGLIGLVKEKLATAQ